MLAVVKRPAWKAKKVRVPKRKYNGPPLAEVLDRIARHREENPLTQTPPKCETCKDTGWQELLEKNTVKRCWRGCEIPRRQADHIEPYVGPDVF